MDLPLPAHLLLRFSACWIDYLFHTNAHVLSLCCAMLCRSRNTVSCALPAPKTARSFACWSSTREMPTASKARSVSCGKTTAAAVRMTGRRLRKKEKSSSQHRPAGTTRPSSHTTTMRRPTNPAQLRWTDLLVEVAVVPAEAVDRLLRAVDAEEAVAEVVVAVFFVANKTEKAQKN